MGILEDQTAAEDRWKKEVRDRLDQHFEQLEAHRVELDAGKERMSSLESKVDANTVITERIEKGVTEILGIFDALKGFVTVGGWVTTGVKWLAGTLIACGIIFLVWKTGELPKKP